MDSYFRSIGFSHIKNRRQVKELIKIVTENPDEQYVLGKNNSDVYFEYYKNYGENFGLVVRGSIDENENIKVANCYPYSYSNVELSCCNIETEFYNGEYIVIGEDENTGNELVFQMQNVLNFLDEDEDLKKVSKVNIAGLSSNGTIILPVMKDEESENMRQEEDANYRELMRKARSGDNSAKEMLDLQEAETTEIMRERLLEEDFLSVVEGFFMPISENETCYSILGDIEKINVINNIVTNETIYQLLINVTGTNIQVCINQQDLMGTPIIGMRFMGSCWLQGRIVFN